MADTEELEYELKRAVQRADLIHTKALLQEIEPQQISVTGQAKLLIAAVQSGEAAAELVSMLLNAGFSPNAVDYEIHGLQETAFFVAARELRLDLMQMLYSAGADPHWRNSNGGNAAGRVLSQASDDSGQVQVKLRIASWLKTLNVFPDFNSEESRLLIFYAGHGTESWADLPGLIAQGIDSSCLGWTPVWFKIASGEAEVDDLLSLPEAAFEDQDSWNRTIFLHTIVAGRKDLAEALLAAGSDLYAKGRCGMNAMHYAACEDHPEIIVWLLTLDLVADTPDESKSTPLMTAAHANSLKAAMALLRAGADVNAKNDFDCRAIHEAVSLEMIQLLVEAGAEINVNGAGEAPLKEAAEAGNATVVRYLLDAGADANFAAGGKTALFAAVSRDSEECVRLLLSAGAAVNVQDQDECTCLYYVESLPVARLLLEHGADPSIPDEIGGLPENWSLPPEVKALYRHQRMNRRGAISR